MLFLRYLGYIRLKVIYCPRMVKTWTVDKLTYHAKSIVDTEFEKHVTL